MCGEVGCDQQFPFWTIWWILTTEQAKIQVSWGFGSYHQIRWVKIVIQAGLSRNCIYAIGLSRDCVYVVEFCKLAVLDIIFEIMLFPSTLKSSFSATKNRWRSIFPHKHTLMLNIVCARAQSTVLSLRRHSRVAKLDVISSFHFQRFDGFWPQSKPKCRLREDSTHILR